MIGLWTGRGIPSGHPLDGVLENLGWFGKRFSPQMRADALLFRVGRSASSPSIRPGFRSVSHSVSTRSVRSRAASNLASYLLRRLRAKGSVASLKAVPFHGVTSDAMGYDTQPIIDHFRKVDDNRVIGAMVIEGDDRVYFFELKRVEEV